VFFSIKGFNKGINKEKKEKTVFFRLKEAQNGFFWWRNSVMDYPCKNLIPSMGASYRVYPDGFKWRLTEMEFVLTGFGEGIGFDLSLTTC